MNDGRMRSPRMKICMLGNAVHCEQVRVPGITPELTDSTQQPQVSSRDCVLACSFPTAMYVDLSAMQLAKKYSRCVSDYDTDSNRRDNKTRSKESVDVCTGQGLTRAREPGSRCCCPANQV